MVEDAGDEPALLRLGKARMVARKEIAPDDLANARVLYEQTLTPVHDIYRLMAVSRSTFYARVREGNWQMRSYSVSEAPDVPIARSDADTPHESETDRPCEPTAYEPVTAERKAALRARLYGMVEEAMNKTAQIVRSVQPGSQAQAERSARTVANSARTMRDFDAILRSGPTSADDANQSDELPGDIDELRLELAERIRTFVDSQSGPEGAMREPDDPDLYRD